MDYQSYFKAKEMEASRGSDLHRAGKWLKWDFNPHLPGSDTKGRCRLFS